ncbi:aspartate aminotransferase family protein [Kitasatospora sp. NPDC052896]|uniref:aspartate aminotransferase family protein n=1 Tax=Kitasatospora sp. NPDC052896 TaxID=3364061 RepID=UPI0037CAA8E0
MTSTSSVSRTRLARAGHTTPRAERVILVEGSGCYVRDINGRVYLDGSAVLGLMQVGHGRRELAVAAATELTTLERLRRWEPGGDDRAAELAHRLAALAPDGLARVYFTSGGADGNEVALRMARYFHHRRGESGRTWILSRRLAYHGSGSVTGMPVYHEGFGPTRPDTHHLTPPYPYRRELYDGADVTEFCLRELRETIERIGPERIAAMIGEPVMGGAGAVVPPPDYWPRVAELLRRHGILLILDEVVTAFGRTGSWFAAEHFGVTPDILVTAKGITSGYLPHGAVLASERVADTVGGGPGLPSGFRHTGHPTACAVALANLDLIEREGLLANAVEIGGHLAGRLAELCELPVVGEVRQLGLLLAVELVADRRTRAPLPTGTLPVTDALREDAGIILRGNPRALVITPPLVLDRTAADRLADGLRSVLGRVRPDGRVD